MEHWLKHQSNYDWQHESASMAVVVPNSKQEKKKNTHSTKHCYMSVCWDCWLGKALAKTKRPVLRSVSNRSSDHELRRFTLLYCVCYSYCLILFFSTSLFHCWIDLYSYVHTQQFKRVYRVAISVAVVGQIKTTQHTHTERERGTERERKLLQTKKIKSSLSVYVLDMKVI